jgi:hypothetical protein
MLYSFRQLLEAADHKWKQVEPLKKLGRRNLYLLNNG